MHASLHSNSHLSLLSRLGAFRLATQAIYDLTFLKHPRLSSTSPTPQPLFYHDAPTPKQQQDRATKVYRQAGLVHHRMHHRKSCFTQRVYSHQYQCNQHQQSSNATPRPITPLRDTHSRQDKSCQPENRFNAIEDHIRLGTSPSLKPCRPLGKDFIYHYNHGFEALCIVLC